MGLNEAISLNQVLKFKNEKSINQRKQMYNLKMREVTFTYILWVD